MKKFSLLENYKYSNEEVEDFFIDFVDNKKFELKEGFITPGKDTFFTDVSGVSTNTKRCKQIRIKIENCNDGINSNALGKATTKIEILENILTTIRQFYKRSGELPNFLIKSNYSDIDIYFYIIGGLVDSEIDSKNEIDKLRDELREILINDYKYTRVNKWTGGLEVKVPKKGGKQLLVNNRYGNDYALYYYLDTKYTKVLNNQPLSEDTSMKSLIPFIRKIIHLNYKFSFSGGDNQVIIKFVKNN